MLFASSVSHATSCIIIHSINIFTLLPFLPFLPFSASLVQRRSSLSCTRLSGVYSSPSRSEFGFPASCRPPPALVSVPRLISAVARSSNSCENLGLAVPTRPTLHMITTELSGIQEAGAGWETIGRRQVKNDPTIRGVCTLRTQSYFSLQ